MGLIRLPKKVTARSTVFDLSSLQENQTLLHHHLNDLLRNTTLSPNANDYHVDIETMREFRSFPTIDCNRQRLNLSLLYDQYLSQYRLVERALAIGEERRMRARMNSRRVQNSRIYHLDENEDRFQAIVGFANRRLSPNSMLAEFERVKKECRAGDMIDINGYRGTGYYFVVENSRENGIVAVKTSGQYGCHLPSEAWPFIQQYGFEFFEKADVWACYLPSGARVKLLKDDGSYVSETSACRIAWLHGGEEVEIDGITYTCEISSNE